MSPSDAEPDGKPEYEDDAAERDERRNLSLSGLIGAPPTGAFSDHMTARVEFPFSIVWLREICLSRPPHV